jgi:hypothetical protein
MLLSWLVSIIVLAMHDLRALFCIFHGIGTQNMLFLDANIRSSGVSLFALSLIVPMIAWGVF